MSELPEAAVHAANAAVWLMVGSRVTLDEALHAAQRVTASGLISHHVRNVAEAWVDPIRSDIIDARRERVLVNLDAMRKVAVEASRSARPVRRAPRGRPTNVYDLGMVRAGLRFGDPLTRALEVSRRSRRDVATMARKQRKAGAR